MPWVAPGTAPFILDHFHLQFLLLELVSSMTELQVPTQLAQSVAAVLPANRQMLAWQSSPVRI